MLPLGCRYHFFDFFCHVRIILYLCRVLKAIGAAWNSPRNLKIQPIMAKGTIALGQFRGKVGGQVFRVVDGKQVMQPYQPIVRNPGTLPQQMQRAAIKTLGKLGRAFLVTLREGYGGVYPASEFIKKNISKDAGALAISSPDDVTVVYPMLKITNGSADGLVIVSGGQVSFGSGQHLQVSCPMNVTVADSVPDERVRIFMVVYCPEMNMSVLGAATLPTAQTCSANCPDSWDGMDVHAWLFASIAENGMDGDAFDQTTLRLPKICTSPEYIGTGELA